MLHFFSAYELTICCPLKYKNIDFFFCPAQEVVLNRLQKKVSIQKGKLGATNSV